MSNHNIDVDILVNAKPIKKHAHKGKAFVEAKEGSEYTIKIRNNNWARKLVVCSVDGINVIDGKAAGASQAGYIINGLSSIEVKGFRVSNDAVNAFKFSQKTKSYAAKSDETQGDTSNCGVIGVQVFDEKSKPAPIVIEKIVEKPVWRRPYWDYPSYPLLGDITYTSNTFGSAGDSYGGSMKRSLHDSSVQSRGLSAGLNSCPSCDHGEASFMCSTTMDMAADSFDLGTEFSKNEIADTVTEVEFETGCELATIELYYASRNSLISMGVPVVKETQVVLPKAFPSKFCRPPKSH